MLSSGQVPGVWILHADISEHWLFHLHRRVGTKNTYPPMKVEQGVPKRRHVKLRHRRVTQKKAYEISILYLIKLYAFSFIYFVPPTWSWPFEVEPFCLIKDITYTSCDDVILFLSSRMFIFVYLICTRSYNKLFMNIFLCFLEVTCFFIFSFFYVEISFFVVYFL